MLWVALSLAAGSCQTLRNALSRQLGKECSPTLVSWARFAFNLPFAATLATVLIALHGAPSLPILFFVHCLVTAVTQLLAAVALVAAFRHASYAQSIVLHKLDGLFTALVGLMFFAELPSTNGWIGIVLSTLGVLWINLARSGGPKGWRRAFHIDRGAGLALLAALLLVVTCFALKEASGALVSANPELGDGRFIASSHTLFHVTWMEVLILTVTLLARNPSELRRVRSHGPHMLAIGAAAFAGSLGWFWAYSLTLVAYVKAVGQIESVLSTWLSLKLFDEKEVKAQIPGIVVTLLGMVFVLFD
ncbi:MAG: hypothetical protein RL885_31865 [Planctomycetota bacterium]